ncbi:siderophore-interacting protein [Streptomyces sp. 35G-GA-8]|uniref:siderophore-interacting protein n=1 Tax=Streptomyces sp. 35G-GA-8 TaxID=2939434 RepID=UPI00201EFB84|nr:siderophore-interacting protein [Streptomyces sp. 35G-GA-8]MCL7379361.1 siderophore-interacting protein [Streptomyces sp. 35G-GA-8]
MTDAPFRFFTVEVLRTERVTPSMARVVLGGPDLAHMATAGRDQRVKLFLPRPGEREPVMPDPARADWYDAWRELDPGTRGIMRTYTVRELRREPAELVIDFALHGTESSGPESSGVGDNGGGGNGVGGNGDGLDGGCGGTAVDAASGPATRWARAARPGARISVLAPVDEENAGYDFRPPEGTDWILLTADESALPAIAGILESLPPGMPARVWIEVHAPADRQELPTKADAEIVWLTRDHDAPPATADAIRAAVLPGGTPYAWIAGESATVKAVRRHLVGERGFDRGAVKFSGYWRRGASEDHLMAAAEEA